MIKCAKFVSSLSKKGASLPPYLVLTGAEEFLRAEARAAFLSRLDAEADLIEIEAEGAEEGTDIRDVFDELRTASLFGVQKAVRVGGAKGFLTKHRKALQAFAESESPQASLILEDDEIVPRRGKVPAAVEALVAAGGVVVDCGALGARAYGYGTPECETELARWIVKRAADRGKTMSLETAFSLYTSEGVGLRHLASEVEKLVVGAGDRKEIRLEGGRGVPEATVFEVVDAFGARELRPTLGALDRLFHHGTRGGKGGKRRLGDDEIVLSLVALVGRRLHELGRIVEMQRQGSDFDAAASKVIGAGRKWLFPKIRAQVRARSARDLGNAVLGLARMEADVKQGRGGARDLFVAYLVEHARAAPSARAAR